MIELRPHDLGAADLLAQRPFGQNNPDGQRIIGREPVLAVST
ncbi:hypothetical protein ACFC26_40260 [Kitasatospora purpeofusca]